MNIHLTHLPAPRSARAFALLLVVLMHVLPSAMAYSEEPIAASGVPVSAGEQLTADTPRTTALGSRFIAPAGWSIRQVGPAVILTAPEPDSRVALVDVADVEADVAVAQAWAALRPGPAPTLLLATDRAPSDGWEQVRFYSYESPASAHRLIAARAFKHGAVWTVAVGDISQAVAEKRGAQFALMFSRLLPKDGERESFAGKTAHRLDEARVAALSDFVRRAQEQLDVPGVAMGLIQDGKVLYQGGFGVRALDKPEAVDAKTLFLVASNTKPLTTLMLAKLVDEKKFDWETPVTRLLPEFRLGDAHTTAEVRVEHLVCACTGLPRRDYEWLMEFDQSSAEASLRRLAGMQPTSAFGALFQYSNPLAAAGGFVGGHVAFPKAKLGAAYDRAMLTRVFAPLGMRSTTFDFARALKANHAAPHAMDIDGNTAIAEMAINRSIVPVRPAGGAWSNVEDLLRYVRLELDDGRLPNGRPLIEEKTLLARRMSHVAIGADTHYGMGLFVDRTWGTPIVYHGGSMIGYQTNMLWLPEHDVGMVLLTNANSGRSLLQPVQRRLLELMFDGRPEAEAAVTASAHALKAGIAAERKRWVVPASQDAVTKLATRYRNASLGSIEIKRSGKTTAFDFGEWRSEVASRSETDGTLTFATISPGMDGFEFVYSEQDPDRLLLRDAQHEYYFSAEK